MAARILQAERRVEVLQRADGSHALHARIAVRPGEVLLPLRYAELSAEPSRHSIQVGAAEHALVEPVAFRFTNHSCSPNVVVDTRARCVRAIRAIGPGDEVTYFYPSTEWSMAEPFACACDSERCLLTIAGAAYLSAEVLAGYELAEHIQQLLEERRSASPERPYPNRARSG